MTIKNRILIVEDEPTCQILLTQALAFKFNLDLAATLDRAKNLLEKQKVDLILLDFYLPDGDAFDLINFVNTSENFKTIPIMLLTTETATQIKVRSFSQGIYDFVTKPFEPAELIARIEAHLSRSMVVQSTSNQVSEIGDLVLESEAQRISIKVEGELKPLDFSPIEYKLLHFMMQHHGKVRTREQLAIAVWSRKHFQSRTIDRHISSIRKKLGPCAGYLQTVSQGGYRLSKNQNEVGI